MNPCLWATVSALLIGLGLGLIAQVLLQVLRQRLAQLVSTRRRWADQRAALQRRQSMQRRFASKAWAADLTLSDEETQAVLARPPRKR